MSYYLKSMLKDFLWLCVFTALLCVFTALLCGAIALFFGCAANHAAATQPAVDPGFIQSLANTQAGLHTDLLKLNILALIGTALGVGAIIYGVVGLDKLVEHIGIAVACAAGALLGVTYLGLASLPILFNPWFVGSVVALGLAGVGYEMYVLFFKKKTTIKAA